MRLTVLALLPLLAACAVPEGGAPPPGAAAMFPGLFAEPEPEAPEPLPPAVVAALPPGVPPSVVMQNIDGCYLYSVEVTDPPSGYPLRDASGAPICEGGASSVAAAPDPVATQPS
jgi:hypothetical protein